MVHCWCLYVFEWDVLYSIVLFTSKKSEKKWCFFFFNKIHWTWKMMNWKMIYFKFCRDARSWKKSWTRVLLWDPNFVIHFLQNFNNTLENRYTNENNSTKIQYFLNVLFLECKNCHHSKNRNRPIISIE